MKFIPGLDTLHYFSLRQAERFLAWLQGILEVDNGPLWFWFCGYPAFQGTWQRFLCQVNLLITGWRMAIVDKQILSKQQNLADLLRQSRDPRLREIMEKYETENRNNRK